MLRRIRSLTIVVLLSLFSSAGADPLVALDEQQRLNPESFYGKDSNQGVYVRDSAVALEKFAHAQRMERLKEWDKSADLYHEILEKYPDRVVPAQTDAQNNIQQYTSVALAAQEMLARWPQEGLAVYRARYEMPASALLEKAGPNDLKTLHQVFFQYFITDSGKTAARRLMDLYFESGDFAGAAWLGDRLLAWHPGIRAERAALLYRTALAHHLSGDEQAANNRLEELKQNHPNDTGVVRGSDIVLAQSLAQELKNPPPVPTASSGDSWPMLGGNPSRNSISSATGRPGARLFSVDLVQRPPRIANREQRLQWEQQLAQDRAQGLTLGIIPVTDRGELFFQDNARIYAVSLESGVPLPGWAQTYGGDRGGQFAISAPSTPRNAQFNVTLTDDAVLAVMGHPDRVMEMMDPSQSGNTRLVCLDRATGKQRWIGDPREFPEGYAGLRTLDLNGSPIVIGNSVYVVGRGGKGMQFEDSYVLSFDLASGALQWVCYIASGNTGANQMWGGVVPVAENISHIAYSSGRLYALTNLGALASIDAYSGTILWLNIYPRDEINANQVFMQRRARFQQNSPFAAPKPWSYNPVIVHEGKVFSLPTDGKHVLVYDAGSGKEIKRISLADLDGCDTLLGVRGDWLVVSGEHRLLCIEWEKYDPQKPDSKTDMIVWHHLLKPAIRGRCYITNDLIYIPTEERLFRVRFDSSGLIKDSYPELPRPWESNEGPGNVLVAQNNVVIAGATRIDVYTDIEVARAKLDAEIAAAPEDPLIPLRYAETMFAAGQLDVAMQKLDDSAGLMGGLENLRSGAARDRLFMVSLTFAQKLMEQSDSRTTELANALFDRAEKAAQSPPQQVSYRTSRAKFAQKQQDFGAVVRLNQEILSDPELRAVPITPEGEAPPTSAGKIAAAAIDELIQRVGASHYAQYESQAAKALAAAGNDGAQLLEIARKYPNSRVSRRAMLMAAKSFEDNQDYRTAAGILRQIPARADAGDAGQIFEALARNYVKLAKYDVAIKQLALGKSAAPSAQIQESIILPDGQDLKELSFSRAESVLRKYKATTSARQLVDMHLPSMLTAEQRRQGLKPPKTPLVADPAAVIGNVQWLVPAMREHERHDRVVASMTDRRLLVFSAGSPQPIGSIDGLVAPPQRLAWLNDICTTWSDTEIASFTEGGEQRWKMSVESLARAEIVRAGERTRPEVIVDDANVNVMVDRRFPQLNARAQQAGPANAVPGDIRLRPTPAQPDSERILHLTPTGDAIVFATSTGRVAALNRDDGKVIWQMRLSSQPIARLVATDDFAVARLADEDGADLVMIDAFSGAIVGRQNFNIEAGNAPVNLALADDGTLVFTLPDRVCGKDLFQPSSELLFQQAAQGGNRLFQNASHPDHLVLSNGRILALSDGGQFVRVYSLETGRALMYTPRESRREVEALLSTGASDLNVSIRVAGAYLYAIGQSSARAYNLDQPELASAAERWMDTTTVSIRDVFITTNFLVLIDAMKALPSDDMQGLPAYRLLAYSREQTPNGESGLLLYDPAINDAAGIVQWQPADGGLYYRTADNKLHWLKGVRQ